MGGRWVQKIRNTITDVGSIAIVLVGCSGLDVTNMAVLLEYIAVRMISFGFLGPNFLNLSLNLGQSNKGRLQKKTVLCGNNSPVGRPPPPTPPVWEFFRRNTVFFSEDVPKQNFFIIVKYVF